MVRKMLVVLICMFAIVQVVHAQYTLYFVDNEEFGTSIAHWWTGLENGEVSVVPGTAEWSSDHGGSAHLTVSGAPSVVMLYQPVGTFLCPGDTITMRISQTNLGNFGATDLRIGMGWDCSFGQRVAAPTAAGDHDVNLICDKFYHPGTLLWVVLVVWPGSGEAWVHYVRLARGGSLGIAESGGEGHAPSLRAFRAAAVPNPAKGRVALKFEVQSPGQAEVVIYDLQGAEVRIVEHACTPGINSVTWNGTDNSGRMQPQGLYFFKARSEHGVLGEGKVVLTR